MANVIEIILLLIIIWLLAGRKSERLGNLFPGGGAKRKIVLDSCALIDGRVAELVGSGFVADELVVPQFILSELQLLADGNDSHKRERARFGLDIAHQLQDTAGVQVTIDETPFAEIPAIDDKLVALAQKLNAQLYTTDYNLAKIAAIKAVGVLNVNELAQRLRPIALPGETLSIKIIQRGSSRDQGVGYLEDGTMIVVDGGARFVGKSIPVTVSRMHQTVAGKMVFGQPAVKRERSSTGQPQTPPATRPAKEATQSAATPNNIRARLSRPRARRRPSTPVN